MSPGDEERQRFREDTDRWLEKWRSSGTNLSKGSLEFVRRVAERDRYRWVARYATTLKHNRSAMNGRQRGYKRRVRLSLRNGLRDLSEFTRFIAPGLREIRPWVTRKDIEEIYDLDDLAGIIGYVVRLLGEPYAERLLGEIGRFYSSQNKSVVVEKRFGHM